MPFRSTRSHRKVYEVIRDQHFSQHKSRFFDSSYIAANAYSEKFIYPGMVVALDSSTDKYVPYSAAASYGTGSDSAVGVFAIEGAIDVTYGDKMIAPVWHAVLVESKCFLYGGALGTIPAAVKTALDDIQWV